MVAKSSKNRPDPDVLFKDPIEVSVSPICRRRLSDIIEFKEFKALRKEVFCNIQNISFPPVKLSSIVDENLRETPYNGMRITVKNGHLYIKTVDFEESFNRMFFDVTYRNGEFYPLENLAIDNDKLDWAELFLDSADFNFNEGFISKNNYKKQLKKIDKLNYDKLKKEGMKRMDQFYRAVIKRVEALIVVTVAAPSLFSKKDDKHFIECFPELKPNTDQRLFEAVEKIRNSSDFKSPQYSFDFPNIIRVDFNQIEPFLKQNVDEHFEQLHAMMDEDIIPVRDIRIIFDIPDPSDKIAFSTWYADVACRKKDSNLFEVQGGNITVIKSNANKTVQQNSMVADVNMAKYSSALNHIKLRKNDISVRDIEAKAWVNNFVYTFLLTNYLLLNNNSARKTSKGNVIYMVNNSEEDEGTAAATNPVITGSMYRKIKFIGEKTLKLDEYQDKAIQFKIRRAGKSWKLDHEIGVRGHYRHYRNGKTVFVEEHKRGVGLGVKTGGEIKPTGKDYTDVLVSIKSVYESADWV